MIHSDRNGAGVAGCSVTVNNFADRKIYTLYSNDRALKQSLFVFRVENILLYENNIIGGYIYV